MTRQQLRQQLRRSRQDLAPEIVAANSTAIARLVSPLLHGARHIGLYYASGNEVSVDALMVQCRDQGCETFVPVVQDDHTLRFAPITNTTTLVTNRYGIREPSIAADACLAADVLDAVLVPLVGFEASCARLGMGGGYYDRTFAWRRPATSQVSSAGSHPDLPVAAPPASSAQAASPSIHSPLLIGVAHEMQCVDTVFADWWDVPLDIVVTEQRVRYRSG
jgi:5-formyltetrahydrofolate cyclo-ligase